MISKYYEINTHITVAYMHFALPNDIHALSPVGIFAHGVSYISVMLHLSHKLKYWDKENIIRSNYFELLSL